MVAAIVDSGVGVSIGTAAAVVVSGKFGHCIQLTHHVLVGQVEAQVAKFGRVATSWNRRTSAIGSHKFVGGVAMGRV